MLTQTFAIMFVYLCLAMRISMYFLQLLDDHKCCSYSVRSIENGWPIIIIKNVFLNGYKNKFSCERFGACVGERKLANINA